MRKIIASLAVAAAFGTADGGTAVAADPASLGAIPTCQEDMSCWNWAKMGNGQRGVTTKSGRFVVVNVAKFRALYFNGRLDLLGQRMRGDATALRPVNVQTH